MEILKWICLCVHDTPLKYVTYRMTCMSLACSEVSVLGTCPGHSGRVWRRLAVYCQQEPLWFLGNNLTFRNLVAQTPQRAAHHMQCILVFQSAFLGWVCAFQGTCLSFDAMSKKEQIPTISCLSLRPILPETLSSA